MLLTKKMPSMHYMPREARVEVIPWKEFQKEIAPMWGVEDPLTIPIINNPYRVIQYPMAEWPDRILNYCIRYIEDGIIKGYTSVYNVSDTVVRIRGIYILPEHRGHGAGIRMTHMAFSLFPCGFNRMIGFFKETTSQRFIDHGSFKPLEGVDWLWSDYQKVRIRALVWERWPAISMHRWANQAFIQDQLSQYGFGGTENLNRSWLPDEWETFARPHAEAYPDVGLRL